MGHLEKRIEAEEARDRLQERLDQAEARLRGVLNSEPESATRAMMWMGRTEQAEKLLIELAGWMHDNGSVEELLPPGFAVRVRAQLDSVESLRKAQKTLGERPPDDEWWEGHGADVRTTTREAPDAYVRGDPPRHAFVSSVSRGPIHAILGNLPPVSSDPEEVEEIKVSDYLGSQVQLQPLVGGGLLFRGVRLHNDRWAEIGRTTLADGRDGIEMARLDADAEGHPIVDLRRGLGLPSS